VAIRVELAARRRELRLSRGPQGQSEQSHSVTPTTTTTSTTATPDPTVTSHRREAVAGRVQLSLTVILSPAKPGLQTPTSLSRFPSGPPPGTYLSLLATKRHPTTRFDSSSNDRVSGR
jgi:hypothetical protein